MIEPTHIIHDLNNMDSVLVEALDASEFGGRKDWYYLMTQFEFDNTADEFEFEMCKGLLYRRGVPCASIEWKIEAY